jgi:hypothetical protein
MALSALVAQMARSTNRSTPHHTDHGFQLQNVTANRVDVPGLRQAGDEDLGAEAPTALLGTLLKSAEAYH